MAFIEVKKRTLAEVYGGTTWTVDHANLRIVEALGAARPAFHFGQVYGSLREALDDETFFEGAPSSDFAAVPLPELVRVPVRTPVPGGRFTEDHRPPSRAWILIAGDILSNGGLRLEERAIAAVEFSFAPHSLTDLCDVVPSMVTLVGEKLLKVGVDYSRNGQIRADTMLTEDGVQTSNATVFFSYSEAVAAADALQARMVAAADWRANSQLGDCRRSSVCPPRDVPSGGLGENRTSRRAKSAPTGTAPGRARTCSSPAATRDRSS